jgi:hypothetical protein
LFVESGFMCPGERVGAPHPENDTMTTKVETALSKRIEWTKEEIQDDRKELAKTLEALSDTAGNEARYFRENPHRTPSLAMVRGQADLVESYVRTIEKKQGVLEALLKIQEWAGS